MCISYFLFCCWKSVPLVLAFCSLHVETSLHPRILMYINLLSGVQHVQVGAENWTVSSLCSSQPTKIKDQAQQNQNFFSSRISESWFPVVFLFADSLLSNHMLELLLLHFLPEKTRVKTQSSSMTEIQICKGPWDHPVGYLQLVHISHVNMGAICSPDLALKEISQPQTVSPSRAQPFYFSYDTVIPSSEKRSKVYFSPLLSLSRVPPPWLQRYSLEENEQSMCEEEVLRS